MAVQASAKTSVFDDFDDDEGPAIFKRNSATPKQQSQPNSVLKKQLPRTSIDRKLVHSNNKPLPWKSPLTSSKASTSSSSSKPPLRPNPSEQGKCTSASKSGNYSDDDMPLSSRLTANNIKKPPKRDEVSDDDMPLSSRLCGHNNNSKKPPSLVSKQNGSNSGAKRPLEKHENINNSNNSSSLAKKPRISDSSGSEKKNKQVLVKAESREDDDHVPISQRLSKKMPVKPAVTQKQIVKKTVAFKKTINNKSFSKQVKSSQYSKSTRVSPSSGDGQKKWTSLVHNGVIFPPPYKPHGVKMLYNGKPVDLTPLQEEVATMYAVMKDTDYVQKKVFRDNFWSDWRKLLGKNHVIQKLDPCDFTPIYEWHLREKEKKKQMSTQAKKAEKEEKAKQEEKYMWAILDGVKEKVGNFKVEPPGLFRGRGEHPKSGKLKRRILPKDVTINIGKDAPIPECPIPGERWKEIRHDTTVTWLAFWNDPINPKEFKYVFLAASSSLKGQSDKEKYEKARLLKNYIHNIRAAYTKDFTSKDVTKQQIAVATYLIDKLALRAGNEKDDDEADTVGCCTLKVENVKAIPPNKIELNFLGKDSIRYENIVEVELPVYKAIIKFQSGKKGQEDLFGDLDTSKLNAHLKELMPGLTAKVFRTYNASITLDDTLNRGTKEGDVEEKKAVYNAANKEVAIICNHQRTVSKSHESQMAKFMDKLQEHEDLLKELKVDLDRAKKGKAPLRRDDDKKKRNLTPDALEKKIDSANVKIEKIKRDMHNKEDTKTVALGTSKLNYLDPRITVAWCKRHEVPIEKIFNKSLLSKFCWAMDVDPDFRF